MTDLSKSTLAGDGRECAAPAPAGSGASAARARIGVVGLRGLPGVMGGVESHCEELLPRIVRGNPDLAVTCVARGAYSPRKRRFEWNGVDVLPMPSTRCSSIEALANTAIAILYFGLRRPAAVHIHAIGPALMTPLAKLLGLKVVVTHHGVDYNRDKWGTIARAILRAGEWAALRYADRVIVVARTLADELCRRCPERADRIRFIPNGVSWLGTGCVRDDALLARLGLTPGRFILSVGRLVPEKGFQDLIAAHERADAGMPLVIAGGADHESAFAKGIRAKASDRIIFTGMLRRDSLATLYGSCNRFVLASRHEGLPISALEAGAAGAPLVLSDIAPNRDLGLDAANYFPVKDVDALAAMLKRGRDDLMIDVDAFCGRFDWDEIARETAGIYREVIAAR